jgi:lipopolysaccharide transport system permease protein
MDRKDLDLIRELAWSDFKLRYNTSILGFLWSFIKPLMLLLVLYVVFSKVINLEIPHYPLFLLYGIIIWNYFYESTSIAMKNLESKRSLIRNVYFPRYILVISSTLNVYISLIVNILLFIVISIIAGLELSILSVMMLFLACLMLLLLTLGLSFLLASYYPKYRDLDHIWSVVLQIGFFVTPIIYTVSMLPERFMFIYMLNPLALIIMHSRDYILLEKIAPTSDILIGISLSVALLVFGMIIFHFRSKFMGEEI